MKAGKLIGNHLLELANNYNRDKQQSTENMF